MTLPTAFAQCVFLGTAITAYWRANHGIDVDERERLQLCYRRLLQETDMLLYIAMCRRIIKNCTYIVNSSLSNVGRAYYYANIYVHVYIRSYNVYDVYNAYPTAGECEIIRSVCILHIMYTYTQLSPRSWTPLWSASKQDRVHIMVCVYRYLMRGGGRVAKTRT